MKAKSYVIWALVRKRPPGEKEIKYQYSVSEPMSLPTANRLLTVKNMVDKETKKVGGIEYQTSFLIKKSMEKIEEILPQFTTNTDAVEDERQFEESGIDDEKPEPFNAEKLKKKYDTDPIIIIPTGTDGEPATITTLPI